MFDNKSILFSLTTVEIYGNKHDYIFYMTMQYSTEIIYSPTAFSRRRHQHCPLV